MLNRFESVLKNPLFLSLYLPSLIYSFSEMMLIPVLPLYVNAFGVEYGVIGLAIAMKGFGMLVGDVPSGVLLRRLKQKHAMLIGVLGASAMMTLLFFAQDIGQVIVIQFISGMFVSLYNIARHQYLAEAVSLQSRGRAIALFGGIHRIAKVVSPVFGGIVAGSLGLRAPFLFFGLFGVIAFLIVWRYMPLLDIQGHGHEGLGTLVATMRQQWYILATAGMGQVLVQTMRQGTQVIVPLYGADVLSLTVNEIGWVLGIASVLEMLMIYPAGLIMDRFGRKYAIVPTFVIQSTAMMMMPLTAGFLGLLGVVSMIGIGNGLSSGTMMTLGADLAPPEARSEFLGLWRLIGDAGSAGGPLAVGSVADALALQPAAVVLACIGYGAAGLFFFLVPETLKKSTVTT